jgi:hypothetical protein
LPAPRPAPCALTAPDEEALPDPAAAAWPFALPAALNAPWFLPAPPPADAPVAVTIPLELAALPCPRLVSDW